MKSTAKTVIFLGTGSDVGKSIVTTAFCRVLKRKGYSVAPFKAQNMSNNSYITLEGGEIGRAQVVQAEACGLEPSNDMNPVLLKPSSGVGAQVVVQGRVYAQMEPKTTTPGKNVWPKRSWNPSIAWPRPTTWWLSKGRAVAAKSI
jgi:adenosylcobyric acid synthase